MHRAVNIVNTNININSSEVRFWFVCIVTMNSVGKNKRKRQAKATPAQIDFMIDYFIQHPHVATGKFQSLHAKSDLAASWEQLAEELNKMGKNERGKDVKSWKSTWRDNKTTVSQKVSRIRANRSRTGNVGGPQVKLTEREEKIMGIMGFDYVEGVECPDAFPEEQLNAIELLAEGDDSILDEDGSVLTLRDYVEAGALDYTNVEFLENVDGGEANLEEGSIPDANIDATLPPPPPPPPATTPSPADELAEPGPSGLNQEARASRVTRPNRRGFSTQLEQSRTDFATLAERQVSCMEMFAKSMEKMAENDRQRNENEKERNEILRTLIESKNERDQIMINLTGVLQECVQRLKQ